MKRSMRTESIAALTLLAACGGSGGSGTSERHAPESAITFVSGTAAVISENQVDTHYLARATTTNGAAVTFAISGGADQAFFGIDATTGLLTFNEPPDFEDPLDDDRDNDYVIVIRASSLGNPSATRVVTVSVTDLPDRFDFEVLYPTPNADLGGAETDTLVSIRVSYEDAAGNVAFVDVNGRRATFDWLDRSLWRVRIPVLASEMRLDITAEDTVGQQRVGSQTLYNRPILVEPKDVAFDTIGSRIVVLDSELDALIGIDAVDGARTVISNATTGIGPMWSFPGHVEIDAASNKAYVVGQYIGLAEVDLATGDRTVVSDDSTQGEPSLGLPTDVIVDRARNRALVLNNSQFVLISVDLDDGRRFILSGPNTGSGPELPYAGMALDAARNRVLVGGGVSLVAVDLDTGDRTLVSDRTIGSGPVPHVTGSIDFDAANNRILMIDELAPSLLAVDLATGNRTVITDWNTGSGPRLPRGSKGITLDADGSKAYVTGQLLPDLLAVDLATGDRSFVSEPTGAGPKLGTGPLALDASNDRILVADQIEGTGRLIALDLHSGDRTLLSGMDIDAGGTLGSGPALSYPRGIAYDAADARVFITDRQIGSDLPSIYAVDVRTADRTLISNAFRGSGPPLEFPGHLDLDFNNNRVLVVDSASILAIELDSGDRSQLAGEDSGAGPQITYPKGIAIDRAQNRAYVIGNETSGGLFTIDLTNGLRELVSPNAVDLGPSIINPSDLALDLSDDRALVTDLAQDAILAIDLHTGNRTIVADAATGSGPALFTPNGIAVDSENHRAFVLNASAVLIVELSSGDRAVVSK